MRAIKQPCCVHVTQLPEAQRAHIGQCQNPGCRRKGVALAASRTGTPRWLCFEHAERFCDRHGLPYPWEAP